MVRAHRRARAAGPSATASRCAAGSRSDCRRPAPHPRPMAPGWPRSRAWLGTPRADATGSPALARAGLGGAALLVRLDARFERSHEVHDLGGLLVLRLRHDVLALGLALDDLEQFRPMCV